MARTALNFLARVTRRGISNRATFRPRPALSIESRPVLSSSIGAKRFVSATPILRKGLSPESENPPPPRDAEEVSIPAVAANITDVEYHRLADDYLEIIVNKLEKLQDEREDVDVEYSVRPLPPPSTLGDTPFVNNNC